MLALHWDPFPELQTERLILRKLRPDDAADMHVLRSDPRTMQWIPRPMTTSIEEALDRIHYMNGLIDAREAINWGVCLKEDDRVRGVLGLLRFKPENYRAEIGYQLAWDYHGKGIMSEAVAAVVEYGFRHMNCHTIEACIDPENIASQKLIEKVGFRKEAHFTEDSFFKGRFRDTLVYCKVSPYPTRISD